MEGTHMGAHRERGPTEHGLEIDIFNHLKSASGLVLAAFSPMHVDRLVSFYKAARKGGRTFVVDIYGAFVLHLVSGPGKNSSSHGGEWHSGPLQPVFRTIVAASETGQDSPSLFGGSH